MNALLDVQDLEVSFRTEAGAVHAVRGVSLNLDPGECLALVGESGSGKSVTARTLVGLAGPRSSVRATRLAFDGADLSGLTESGWRRIRGKGVGLVLQDALVSLDPLRTVGAEVGEALREHGVVPRSQVPARVEELLARAGVPDPASRAKQYPHQLSGGLRQRALIASALAADPRVLLADEPTTALDVTVQAQVLDLLDKLKREGTALLLISHDLAVVARLADRIAVMYAGRVVEQGPAAEILANPQHPYTQALIAAVPHVDNVRTAARAPIERFAAPGPDGCPYASRCARADDACRAAFPAPAAPAETAAGHSLSCIHPGADPVLVSITAGPAAVRPRAASPETPADPGELELLLDARSISKHYRTPDGARHDALLDVSFQVRRGETLGLVGESGSGKTTAARVVLGLIRPDAGEVDFAGTAWSERTERDRRALRGRIQAVPQDPLGSFDPRHTVGTILAEAIAASGTRTRRPARRERAAQLLDQVGLDPALLDRRPADLSGGQRQRVAIARALVRDPDLLVCDEPVSALDVSVQAQVLDLLADLRHRLGLAMLFISHDLGVIREVSDRVAVMQHGRIVETADAHTLFTDPRHPYTRDLLAAVPSLTPSPDSGRVPG
jgi:peptide/nickel transport system ATP-binding protein